MKLRVVVAALFAFSFTLVTPPAQAATSAVAAYPAWAPWTTYAVGALVTHNGVDYQARQGHTSQPGWEPPNVPALWLAVTGGPATPGQPGTASVTGSTNTSISLSWGAASGTVTGYRVYEGTTQKAQVTGTAATISGLGTCTTHAYTVRAYNTAGEGPATGAVSGTTTGCTGVPGKVGTVTATATNTSVTLSWPAVSGATGYKVRNGGTLVATVTGTSYTITGLAACTPYTFMVTASNASGDGPPSDPVTVTTPGCTGGTLPKHFLTGYWHNFVNPATELKLSQVPNEYDVVAIAFGEATATPGQVVFALDSGLATAVGGYTEAQFKADIQALHQRGKKVILSVGGETGRVQVASSAAASVFASSVHGLMQSYGFDGVDIDLENGLNATYMAQALRDLRSRAGSSLIIMMAPQTIDMQSTGMEYFKLALSIKDILTVVNMQYYNSGSMLGCDQAFAYSQGTVNFMTALACIQLENGLRPDQVALGLPAGPGAAGGGVVAPSMVNQALDCLAKRTSCGTFVPPRAYPDIRGAMTWSINWDASNNWTFAKTVKPHLQGMP